MSIRRFRASKAGSPTAGDWLNAWIAGRLSLRPSTQMSYRGHIERYLVPHLGHVVLEDLKPSHIHTMNRELLEGNGRSALAPATIRRVHATLHAALEAAVREDPIAKNPATGLELPTRPHREPATWTLEQAVTFLRGWTTATRCT